MRDAFGGAFMIKLFLVFIIIYVGFTAIALNYAKAFKVKNRVIEYIETNEISNIDSMTAAAKTEMKEYFDTEIHGKMNYIGNIDCSASGSEVVYHCEDGIKISEPAHGTAKNTEGTYYKVTVSVGWSIPFINKILALNGSEKGSKVSNGSWTVSGETRLIVNE